MKTLKLIYSSNGPMGRTGMRFESPNLIFLLKRAVVYLVRQHLPKFLAASAYLWILWTYTANKSDIHT